jgi:hypothetical protein
MPHPIDDEAAAALKDIRKNLLDIKIAVDAMGPAYRLAVAIGMLSDLVEVLLQRSHTHSGGSGPLGLQRFGGG